MAVDAARYARLIQNMAELAVLREELKRRTMIYQYDEKMRAAKFFGLTFEQVNVEYSEWAKIRERYNKQQ